MEVQHLGGRPAAMRARHLVGRDDELERLSSALARVATEGSRLVLVEGEAGAGKSALARHFVAHVCEGATVWRSSGAEAEQNLDFGVADQLLTAGSPDTGGLFADRWGQRPDALSVGDRLLGAMLEGASDGPLVVVVDDGHWCDVPSLQALTYCARRLGAAPVLILVFSRPDQGLEPLERLCRDDHGEQVRLGGLDVAQLADLVRFTLGATISPEGARRLHSCTDGNPLQALAIADEVDPESLARGVGDLAVPPSFATLTLSRLAAASPEVERVVVACAVHGHPVPLATLAATLESGNDLAGLDEAVTRGFITVDRRLGQTVVDVAHPLTRACVLEDLPPHRLAALHHRAAKLADDPVRAMAHRLRASLEADADLALAAVDLATERIARGWDLEAAELLSLAAPLLDDDERRCQVLLTAASRLLTIGDRVAAAQLLSETPAGESDGRRALVEGQLALSDGKTLEARTWLKEAWTASTDAPVRALAAGLLAVVSFNAGQLEWAITWSSRALESGRRQSVDLGHPLVMHATCTTLLGHPEESVELIDRWEPLLVTPAARADARCARAHLDLWNGELAEAERGFSAVLNAAESVPLLTRATCRYQLGETLYRAGDWDGALRRATEAVAVLTAADHLLPVPMAHSIAAYIAGARGHLDLAADHLAAGAAAVRATGNLAGQVWLIVAQARPAAAEGDHEKVASVLLPLAEMLTDVALPERVLPWAADLVEALAAQGRIDEATPICGRLDSQDLISIQEWAGAARAQGILRAASGDDEGATQWFSRGLAAVEGDAGAMVPSLAHLGVIRRVDLMPSVARLRLAAGAHALNRGASDDARSLLLDARKTFVHLGAVPWVAQVDGVLAILDPAAVPLPPSPASLLTPAETAVVEWVAQGLTNREVAERLYVGVKTIESHLSHAFAKAGVRSRTELALWWQGHESA